MNETFLRSLRRARRGLVFGRVLEAAALALSAGVFGAAIGRLLGGEGVPAVTGVLAAAAALAWGTRRSFLALEAAARRLDVRCGGGDAIASALAVVSSGEPAGPARLCVREATRRLARTSRTSLARPSASALAAIPIAAALAFAMEALRPASRRFLPLSDLERVEGFARSVGGARGEILAAEAARLRQDLARDGPELTPKTAVRIADLGREVASLVPPGEPGAGGIGSAGEGRHEDRAAALRLARIVEDRLVRPPRPAEEAPAAGAPAAQPATRPSEALAAVEKEVVPLRYEAVVSRYFARNR